MLTLFKSPFPIYVAKEVFSEDIKYIVNLYNKSLLMEIKSETSFGKIKNPDYWLYSIHPAIRNYLEKTIQKTIGKTINDLEEEYAHNFCKYYHSMLWGTYKSIGKDDHRSSIARFNLIYNKGSKNNDFDRIIKFADNNDLIYSASICRALGNIIWDIGLSSKALDYHNKALGFNEKQNNKGGMAEDYKSIGVSYHSLGNYKQALEYYNKALEIDLDLNNRVGIAKDYGNIGAVYVDMCNHEQALEYYNKALEIDTELNNRGQLSKDYNNIAGVYWILDNLQQSLNYMQKALDIDRELNDSARLAEGYRNIGLVYGNMCNHEQALEYYNKALEIDTELNDKVKIARDYYSPLLKDVEDRISKLEQNRE
jgi:tetratricopeptide (TPR) repeat protein